MDIKTLLIILGLGFLAWAANTNAGVASTTQAQSTNCLQSIKQQYSGQWGEMNQVQRAMVGLRASACEEGR